MVSKAADRSSKHRQETCCEPIAFMRWSWRESRTVSVECAHHPHRPTRRHLCAKFDVSGLFSPEILLRKKTGHPPRHSAYFAIREAQCCPLGKNHLMYPTTDECKLQRNEQTDWCASTDLQQHLPQSRRQRWSWAWRHVSMTSQLTGKPLQHQPTDSQALTVHRLTRIHTAGLYRNTTPSWPILMTMNS